MKIEGDAKLISAAFVKARKEMGGTVAKDGKGNYGKYATLAAIVEATTDVLAANGLAIIQEAHADEQGLIVDTWLVHESGATMQFAALPMPLTNRTAQAVGSAITYARRYQLAAVCGLAPDDDDGQAAQDAENRGRAQRQGNRTSAPAKAQQKPVVQVSPPTTEQMRKIQEGNPSFHESVASAEEVRIMSEWGNRTEAEMWAVDIGACANEFEAKNSLDKVVKEYGGKVTKENIAAVYLAFCREQLGKLEMQQAA